MNDLISRQAAIDEIEERKNANGYRNVAVISELNRLEGYIMRLPSAQPDLPIKEKCAFCPHCNNCDVNDDLSIQPCVDTISRQAAIEVIDAVFPVDPMKSEYAQGIACGAALAKTYVEQLPSAQSERTANWTDGEGNVLKHWIGYCAVCSACGEMSEYLTDYCPNCGAKMEEGR